MGWRLTVIVLAVVVAGCGSIAETDPATETVTPAPVPTTSPGDAGETLPPGVTGGGVVDSESLLEAHMSEVRDQSYTLRVRINSDNRHAERLLRVETPTRYYLRDSLVKPARTITKFADGTFVYTNFTTRGSAKYGRANVSKYPSDSTVRLSGVFLGADNVTVAKTLVNGELQYEVSGSYDVHPRVSGLKNFSVRAVISPDGFIRSMNVSYRRDGTEPRTTVVRGFEYSNVGNTTVERPQWVDANWNQTDD